MTTLKTRKNPGPKPDLAKVSECLTQAAELIKEGGFDEDVFDLVRQSLAAIGIPESDLPGW
jgi:hypothetical protein